MRDAGIIGDDFHLGPAVGQQADHKFDREPRAANDRLIGEHAGIERNAWTLPLSLVSVCWRRNRFWSDADRAAGAVSSQALADTGVGVVPDGCAVVAPRQIL